MRVRRRVRPRKLALRWGALGFTIATVGNGTTTNPTQGAVIRYGPATGLLAAQTLQAYILGETALEPAPDLAGTLLN